MHDFYYFLYLGCLFIHLNIIVQVSQHSSNFFFNLSTTMLTSALIILSGSPKAIFYACIESVNNSHFKLLPVDIACGSVHTPISCPSLRGSVGVFPAPLSSCHAHLYRTILPGAPSTLLLIDSCHSNQISLTTHKLTD